MPPVPREQRGQYSSLLHGDGRIDGGEEMLDVEQLPVDPGIVVVIRGQGSQALEFLDLRPDHGHPPRADAQII